MMRVKNTNAKKVTGPIALALLIGASQGCAPRIIQRAPAPPPTRAPMPAPAPEPPVAQPPAPPPPVKETTRKPLLKESNIREQNLPPPRDPIVLRGGPEASVPPLSRPSSLAPVPSGPLPDDSSLIAKITPNTSPQRAASLRLTHEGRKLLESGDAARALTRLERTIAIDATNAYGYFYLAKAHYQLGRYKESLNFLDVAETRLAGEPFWLAEVHALRGENFRALGMTARAEASFNKALSINSGNRTAAEALSSASNDPAATSR